jgi:hypothetical protein
MEHRRGCRYWTIFGITGYLDISGLSWFEWIYSSQHGRGATLSIIPAGVMLSFVTHRMVFAKEHDKPDALRFQGNQKHESLQKDVLPLLLIWMHSSV